MGVYGIDLDTLETFEKHMFTNTPYGSFSPFPSGIAASVVDQCVYVYYDQDYQFTNQGNQVIYKYDPSDNTFDLYHRGASGDYFKLLRTNQHAYLHVTNSSLWTTIDLSTLEELVSDATPPASASSAASNYQLTDDGLEEIFYKSSTGILTYWSITDETTTTIDLDLESYTNGASIKIYLLKDAFMIVSYKYVSPGVYSDYRFVVVESV